jgi:hypothetical protein
MLGHKFKEGTMRPQVLLALAALAATAFAPAGQPDPKRNPTMLSVDLDFAVKELCAPWLAATADVAALTDRPGVVRAPSQPAWAAGGEAYMVGSADLMVSMATSPRGAKTCTLRSTRGDPDKLRAALGKTLETWRVPLTPSVHKFPPGAYARRDVLCSPKEGLQDSVLISIGAPRGPVPLMVTLMTNSPRDPRCDAAG